jgi:hypothetical protein
MTDSIGESSIKILSSEYDYISKYNFDPDNLIAPEEKIVNTQFIQNDDSTWSKIEYESKNPNELPSIIIDREKSNREEIISNLKDLSKSVDQAVLDFNNQINYKKNLIISTLSAAVSGGCSVTSGINTNAANVNGTGVSIGIGSTVRGDTAYISVYANIENYSATSFGPISTETLSGLNIGNGYQTTVSNNGGSILSSNYEQIDTSPPFNTPTCVSYYNTITTLAQEINNLRTQRDSIDLTNSNLIKSEKSSQEIRRWGFNRRDESISERQLVILTSINAIRSV